MKWALRDAPDPRSERDRHLRRPSSWRSRLNGLFSNGRRRAQGVAVQLASGLAGLAMTTFVCFQMNIGLARTGFAYIILISLVSLLGSFIASVVLSIVAVACLDYFFAPPLFEFGNYGPDDVERIVAFLTTSLVVTALTARLNRSANVLREDQVRWDKAEQMAHFGWWERDFISKKVSLSDEVSRIFGVQPIDLPNWHGRWVELIHPDDRAKTAAAAAAALTPGGPRYDVEYRIVRADGTVRMIRSQGDVTWDHSGKPLRQFGVLHDITELRQAERELRSSEARFRTFVDHARDAFYLFDDEATVIDVNREACESLGYSREELIGKHPTDFDSDLDWPTIERLKARMLAGETVTFETRHTRKDGTSFPVEIRAGKFEQGGRRFLSLARDITERKRAQDELRASEERFRALVNFSFDVYYETDAQYRYVRREFTKEVAGEQPPLGTMPWETPYLEPDAEGWRKFREGLDARLPFQDFEVARLTPSGVKRYMSVSGLPVFDETGNFVGYRGVGRDITERKRAEEALRRSAAYLAEAQRLSHTGTSVFDASGKLYWSDECYRIWELDPQDGLPDSDTILQRIHPDDRDRVHDQIQRDLHHKREQVLEFRLISRDGTIKYIETTSYPLFSAQGQIAEVIATHVDVTERRHAKEQAEKLRQLEADLAHMHRLGIMGELTASLAHEILHPIATARNNARAGMRMLDASPQELGEVKEALACVVRDADRARDIVGRIRDHIKKAPPRRQRFDFNEAVDEVLAMVRDTLSRSSISARTSLMVPRAAVRGDRIQLQQVMLNLILNAVEAMASTGERTRELVISTEPVQEGAILVRVCDTGPGISPDQAEQIFEPFYTTKLSGIGLGLSICRSIIDAQGGRLWTEIRPSGGAVFQFTLPAAESKPAGSDAPLSAADGREADLVLDHTHAGLTDH